MKLRDFFKTLGYDIRGLSSGFSNVQNYFSWYKGFVENFHRYYVYNGERTVAKERYSLQLCKKICENFADLLLNEKVEISLGNDTDTKKLNKILQENKFHMKANQGIEKTFALGMGAFLLSLEDVSETDFGRVKIQFVNAENIYPLTFDENEISECAFTSFGTELDAKTKKFENILNLQIHTKNDKKFYVIKNFKFIVNENEELTQVENENANLVETGMTNRWFFPIKPNIINNLDLYSPFGISIFANALSTIKALDLTFDSLVNEIQNGRKRLFVTADAMKVSSDGTFKNAFDPNDVLFYTLDSNFNADGKQNYVQEVNGQLRVNELKEALQTILNLLANKLGLGDNYYKFDNNSVTKTATEVISENSDLFRTLNKHKVIIEDVIKELVTTIGIVTGLNTENITVDFDDSIIESKEQKFAKDSQELALETMSRAEFRMRHHKEDETTAKAKISEIDAEKSAGAQINFIDEEVD